MKNTNFDIMLICKWHFDRTKHQTIKDALRAYISSYTGVENNLVSEQNIINFLSSAVQEYVYIEDLCREFESTYFTRRYTYFRGCVCEIYIDTLMNIDVPATDDNYYQAVLRGEKNII